MICGFAGWMMIVLVSPLPCVLTTCLSFDCRFPAACAWRRTCWIAAITADWFAATAWPSCVVQEILSLIILSTVGYDRSAWMLGSHCDAVALSGRQPFARTR